MVLSPQLARKRFGNEVRRQRDLAGMTQTQLGRRANLSQAFIGAIERGEKAPKRDKVVLVDAALNTKESLLSLWDSLFSPNGLSAYYRDIAVLEREASEIREYRLCALPGLLQTEEYARAFIRVGRPAASSEQVEEAVRARIGRQSVLDAEKSHTIYALVLDEAVLRHVVGDPEIMVRQLERLLMAARQPNISVQVIPYGTRNHPGLDGSFLLITVPERGQVVYTETRASGTPVEDSATTNDYARVFGDLRGAALPGEASQDYIRKIMEEYAR